LGLLSDQLISPIAELFIRELLVERWQKDVSSRDARTFKVLFVLLYLIRADSAVLADVVLNAHV